MYFRFFLILFFSNFCYASNSSASTNDKRPETWTISASFDEKLLGNKALGNSSFRGGAGQTEIVDLPVLRKKSAKLTIKSGQTGYGKWGGEWQLPKRVYSGETVWFSVHTFFPKGFDYNSYGEGNRLKFLRIGTKSSTGKHHGFNDLYINREGNFVPFRFIYEGAQRWKNVGIAKEHAIQRETWENYQMAITFDNITKNEGGNAEILIWKNGVLVEHITDRKTLKNSSDYADRALLFTYWNGGAPKTQSMYVDEITITNRKPIWNDLSGYPIVPFYTDLCRIPN